MIQHQLFYTTSEFPPACLNGQLPHEAGLLLVVFLEPMRSSLAKETILRKYCLKKYRLSQNFMHLLKKIGKEIDFKLRCAMLYKAFYTLQGVNC